MSTDKSASADSHGNIVKSTSVISLGTLSSRVLGFIRDILFAQFLGTAARADAFFVAFRIPNLFRDMLAEGAANSAIVPVLAEYKERESKKELGRFISTVFILSFLVLTLITVIGIFLAPLLVRIMAPGFIRNPENLHLTVQLTRIMFPYLILIGLTAYAIAILYTFRSFVSAAFGPCLLNVAMIASLILSTRMKEPVYGLAIGVLAGGILQLGFQLKPLLRAGIDWSRPKTLNHAGAKKVGRLILPRLFGSGIYQLNVTIDTLCASLSSVVGAGGISAIYYSSRIIQFPVGVFVAALASVVLPALSTHAAMQDLGQFKKTLIFSLKNILFLMVPAGIFLMLFSVPIVRVLFERGEFDAYSTRITAQAVLFFAVGLFFVGGTKILVSGFYALQDTLTPVKAATRGLIINGILNLVLMWPLKVGGIALASSIAAAINFGMLLARMDQRIGNLRAELKGYSLKISAAAVCMAVGLISSWRIFNFLSEPTHLMTAAAIGFFIYMAVCFILKVDQVMSLWQGFKFYIFK